jgi:hypothetical protein|tara:strand:+ start:76 stop:360 length:285 start_codon:yes stop_codon:yes gene_type:complete
MNPYQTAIKALENCVKDAMENNVDPGLQMEIWRHYQGMKAIDRQLPKQKEYKFSLADDQISISTSYYDPDYNVQAAQPVELDFGGGGNDVITFS